MHMLCLVLHVLCVSYVVALRCTCVARCMLHVARCVLCIASCALRIAHCAGDCHVLVWRTGLRCALHVARCAWHVVHCTLRVLMVHICCVACCMFVVFVWPVFASHIVPCPGLALHVLHVLFWMYVLLRCALRIALRVLWAVATTSPKMVEELASPVSGPLDLPSTKSLRPQIAARQGAADCARHAVQFRWSGGHCPTGRARKRKPGSRRCAASCPGSARAANGDARCHRWSHPRVPQRRAAHDVRATECCADLQRLVAHGQGARVTPGGGLVQFGRRSCNSEFGPYGR